MNHLWRHPKNVQGVGSGVLVNDHVYIMDENGVPRYYDVKTGKEKWNVESRPGYNVN